MWRLSQFFVFPRRGYYTYAGRNHDVCEFQLQFLNGNVEGRGVDDVGRALPGEVLGKVKLGQNKVCRRRLKTIEVWKFWKFWNLEEAKHNPRLSPFTLGPRSKSRSTVAAMNVSLVGLVS
jgi:hypothetical protein